MGIPKNIQSHVCAVVTAALGVGVSLTFTDKSLTATKTNQETRLNERDWRKTLGFGGIASAGACATWTGLAALKSKLGRSL